MKITPTRVQIPKIIKTAIALFNKFFRKDSSFAIFSSTLAIF